MKRWKACITFKLAAIALSCCSSCPTQPLIPQIVIREDFDQAVTIWPALRMKISFSMCSSSLNWRHWCNKLDCSHFPSWNEPAQDREFERINFFLEWLRWPFLNLLEEDPRTVNIPIKVEQVTWSFRCEWKVFFHSWHLLSGVKRDFLCEVKYYKISTKNICNAALIGCY